MSDFDADIDLLIRKVEVLKDRLTLLELLISEVDVLPWEQEFEDWRYA